VAVSAAAAAKPPVDAVGDKDLKVLMDRFQKEARGTRQGVVPIAIAFPQIGSSLFLAAELTPEAQAPAFDLQYRRTIHQSDEKGGF
jgi:hypothetical protein